LKYINKIFVILDNKNKKKFLILLFFIILTALMETISVTAIIPLISFLVDSQNYIDKITNSNIYFLNNVGVFLKTFDFKQTISIFLFFIIFLFILKSLIVSLSLWLISVFVASVENSTSKKLFNFYLRQNYSVHLYRDSSELLQNFVQEVSRFAGTACLPLVNLISESLILISITIILFIVEPFVSTIIFIFLAMISSVYFILVKTKMKNWGEQRIFYMQKRVQDINQSIGGIREILLMWRQNFFYRSFMNNTIGATNVGKKQYFFNSLPKIILELSAVFVLIFLIYFLLFIKNSQDEVVPVVALFAAAAFKLIPSANRILSALQFLRFSIPNVDRIYKDIIKIDETNTDNLANNKENIQDADFRQFVELKDISFSYISENSKKQIFKKLNLKINKGDVIGLVGETGSGKTTLVDIFLGLLFPEEGKILIDGKSLKHSNQRNWQNKIGYVPQDVYLLNDSIKKNIAFGLENKDVNLKRVNEVIKISRLKKFVENSKYGIETLIGERGSNLSGGQRQRIGIARSIYNDPEILLFDEATSSLDSETEMQILDEIFKIKKNKTVIIISHKHSTLKNCDKIYKLSEGNLDLIK
tara:strand:+ start:510 stop:2276 length:1767 start_codon:yes stop_codon:yes gene_type:complete